MIGAAAAFRYDSAGFGMMHGSNHRRAGMRGARAAVVRRACYAALGLTALAAAPALANDDAEDAANPASTLPNIYLDLTTTYSTTPANSLSLGFRPTAPLLSHLSPVTLTAPASQGIAVNAPVTVDVNDRLSLNAGVQASTSRPDGGQWSTLTVDSWSVGFLAELIQQNGGNIPTVKLQTTFSRSIPSGPLATTSFDNILEASYALDTDETRGLLAGVRVTSIWAESALINVDTPVIGYLGGYYQWPNNWKLTGRAGVQSFGGVHLDGPRLDGTPIKPFTGAIVNLELDRMDDNDNRLFGVAAQLAWTPTISFLLMLRTPLYAVRN